MKIRICGNRELLQEARLSRDLADILRLELKTTERGASFYLGSNGRDDEGRWIEGPCVIIAPPEEVDVLGCTILLEGESSEEHEELLRVYPYTTQSKENIYFAYLPMLERDAKELDGWEQVA